MVDGQLGNEIDGCGDDVEQFVCAQVNSILQRRYLKKKTIGKNLHLLYSVEALQTNDALDATSPSIAAGIIVTFTFAHTLQMSFITFIRLKWCVMVYGRIVTSSRPIDKIPYIFNR